MAISFGPCTTHIPLLFGQVFVQCDSDLMLARRIRRDVADRGRDVGGVIDQYLRFVKPAYDNFVLPSSRHADIIVPGFDNAVRDRGDHDHMTPDAGNLGRWPFN